MKLLTIFIVVAAIVLTGGYYALIYYDVNFPYGRMWETPAVRPHEEPLPLMASDIVPFDGGEVLYATKSADELQSPLNMMDSDIIAQGKEGYFNYCAQCHGKKHDGNGTVGQSFAPLPADLRDVKVQARTDGSLFHEISYGTPDGRQPALASTIAPDERWRIVAYVKSLGPRP